MALLKCKDCNKDVSSEAKACPHCGAPVPKKKSSILGFLFAVVLLGIAASMIIEKTTPPPLTAEEKAARDKERQAQSKRDAAAATLTLTVKKSLRNPASVQWGNILTNDDGSVVCIDYRAQNGFGGMNHEMAMTLNGQLKKDAASWNRHCANKELRDVKDFVLRAIDGI